MLPQLPVADPVESGETFEAQIRTWVQKQKDFERSVLDKALPKCAADERLCVLKKLEDEGILKKSGRYYRVVRRNAETRVSSAASEQAEILVDAEAPKSGDETARSAIGASEAPTPPSPANSAPLDEVCEVPIKDVVSDRRIQPRAGLSDETIEKYRAALTEGDAFTPILLIRVDGRLVVVDGAHRREAFERAGRTMIPAIIRPGSPTEAMAWAVKANLKHGLSLSRKEIRTAITRLLNDKGWVRRTDVEIAKATGVSSRTIGTYRKKLSIIEDFNDAPRETTRNGKPHRIKTGGIGRKPKAAPPAYIAAPATPSIPALPSSLHYGLTVQPRATREPAVEAGSEVDDVPSVPLQSARFPSRMSCLRRLEEALDELDAVEVDWVPEEERDLAMGLADRMQRTARKLKNACSGIQSVPAG